MQLEQALPPAPNPACLLLAGSPAVRRRLVLTLLFLGAVGLQRTWDLRGYTADGLALLTGRRRAYSYRYAEAFLSQITHADGAKRFTEMLGSWATHLWHSTEAAAEAEHAHALQALICYVVCKLARIYIHRWSAQENVIKDYLRPLGLDINHGFAEPLSVTPLWPR